MVKVLYFTMCTVILEIEFFVYHIVCLALLAIDEHHGFEVSKRVNGGSYLLEYFAYHIFIFGAKHSTLGRSYS